MTTSTTLWGAQPAELAKRFGTPLYVYSQSGIESQYYHLHQALQGISHLICFAVKANSNLSILRLLKNLGAGFDIVSEGELRRLLTIGADPKKIVFAGVAKTRPEIEFALHNGIRMFNVESAAELELIEKVAAEMGKVAPVSFRINPDVSVDTHPYIATGLMTSKFGIPVEDARALFYRTKNSAHLDFVGIDCHIGSGINDVAPFEEAYSKAFNLALEFKAAGAPIRYLDLGGGLGVSFSGHYEPLNIPAFGSMVKNLIKDAPFEVLLEPGKFLLAEAGALLTEVVSVKENERNKFIVVDAGMNDLIRPSLYEAFHHVDVVTSGRQLTQETFDVVGPVCESGCYFARARQLPRPAAGDYVIVRDAGAYGFSMASHYNTRRLPAEILIDLNGSPKLIRRREDYEELWAAELVETATPVAEPLP